MTTKRVRVVGVRRAEIDFGQLAHALLRHLVDQLDQEHDTTDQAGREPTEVAS